MCGRYGLYRDPSPFARTLGARVPNGFAFVPHYNIAPQTAVLAIRNAPERELRALQWGLATRFARDPARRVSTFNARIETLATSPLYGPLLPHNRCIVPADGYYEWQRLSDGTKAPVWVTRSDGEPLAFAGLWNDDGGVDGVEGSCTIVTQPANRLLERYHERMPVALEREAALAWLDAETLPTDVALAILAPIASENVVVRSVGPAVGNVRNDGPELIAPVEPPRVQPTLFDAPGQG
jgi:putative SOS response-associated peptidase YedK